MVIKESEVRRYSALVLILFLAVVSFLILKPILLSIIGGLLLAYIFLPVYRQVFKVFRERTTTALAVCVLVILGIFIPLWFLIPITIRQTFDMFTFIQTVDIGSFIRQILPTSSAQLQTDITSTLVGFIGKSTTSILSGLTNILLNLPTVLLNLTVVLFVFFFAMRDADKLGAFISDLSPLKKEKKALFAKQFKGITNSLIYGNFIIGILQGVLTGIGLFIFGVPRPLLLTLFAILAAILPIVGAWLVWIPATLYILSLGKVGMALGFAAYCIIIVSTIDNFLRPYLVARKTKSSSGIILIGMLGGLVSFGILGLLLGPLVLEYFLLFIDAYRQRALSDFFESE